MRSNIGKIFLALIFFSINFAAWAGEEGEEVQISYVKMAPSITSNLSGGPEYIRCDIQLMTEYASFVEPIEIHMPAIRHSVLMLIAGEDGNKLKGSEGKEALRQQTLETIQNTLKEITGKKMIKDLYFTAYYVK